MFFCRFCFLFISYCFYLSEYRFQGISYSKQYEQYRHNAINQYSGMTYKCFCNKSVITDTACHKQNTNATAHPIRKRLIAIQISHIS